MADTTGRSPWVGRQALRRGSRFVAPIVDAFAVRRSLRNLRLYAGFFRDFRRYQLLDSTGSARMRDLWPRLGERDSAGQTGADHYFYQDTWALHKLAESSHPYHVDVGSRIDGFVGQATAIKPTLFIDIRAPRLSLGKLSVVGGSILELPLRSRSVPSLSSLHVIEHIGLGRYGDALNARGTELAAGELKRALASGGDLYIGVPVGKPVVQFNAHRILSPDRVLSLFDGLQLVEFSGIDDDGHFHRCVPPHSLGECDYACGLFHFRRS